MAELSIKFDIPSELEEELEESNLDLSNLVRELVIAKLFELQLSKSRALQRAVFEALSSKSKLTEEDAIELGNKLKRGTLEELKEKGLVRGV